MSKIIDLGAAYDKQFERVDIPSRDAVSVSRYFIEIERELAEAKRNYMELIMAVGNVYPNETRHQTALRYIKERETPSVNQAKCFAIAEGK